MKTEGRDWLGGCTTGQECQQPPDARRGKTWVLPKSLWRKCGPSNTSISSFWPPEPSLNTFLWLQAAWRVVICYSSHRKLTQHTMGWREWECSGSRKTFTLPWKDTQSWGRHVSLGTGDNLHWAQIAQLSFAQAPGFGVRGAWLWMLALTLS